MLAVNVPAEIERRAALVAGATGRPLLSILETALSEGLDEMEEMASAEARLEAIHSGKVKTVDLQTLIDGLGD
ncbi:MAG TPA: hypothetical protein VMV83_07915 [Rectinemataceae bacterium]|nr:hypothetical protein [Rectinemataceae bacterium]